MAGDDEHVTLHLAHVKVTLHTTSLLHAVLPLLDEVVSLALRVHAKQQTDLRRRLENAIHIPVLVLVRVDEVFAAVATLTFPSRAEAVAATRFRVLHHRGIVLVLGCFQHLLLRRYRDCDLE